MAKIAFLGLGQMGAPMAARLLRQRADGLEPPAGPRQAVSGRRRHRGEIASGGGRGRCACDHMLATPEALKDVVLGAEHGLVRALGPGQMYIDMSTVGPHTVRLI